MSTMGKIKPGNYQDGQQYYDQPYTEAERHNVYIPKQADKVIDLIAREKERERTLQGSGYDFRPVDSMRPQTSQVRYDTSKQNYDRPSSHQSNRSSFRNKLQENISHSRQYEQNQDTLQLTKSANNFRQKNLSSKVGFDITSQQKRWTPKSTGYTQQQEQLKQTQQKLRSKLYFDEKTMSVPKTTLKNKVIENIVQDPNVFLQNKPLLESVYKLKQLNLLKNHDIHVNRMRGIGKFDYVFNDYHSKATNNGFSRNNLGGFYTR